MDAPASLDRDSCGRSRRSSARGVAPGAPAERRPAGGRVGRARRRAGGAAVTPRGDRLLEALESRHQAVQIGAGGIVGELHQRDLEQQPRIGCVAHLDEHLAEPLHRPHDRRPRPSRVASDDTSASRSRGQLHQLGCHQRQEAVAQVADDVLGERARIAALLHGVRDDRERPAGVVLDERLDELVERRGLGRLATAGGDELERRDRVACRTAALAQHRLHRGVGDLDARVGREPADVLPRARPSAAGGTAGAACGCGWCR